MRAGRTHGPMGTVEYVVETRRHGAVERWLVVRPHDDAALRREAPGVPVSPNCRVVVEEGSLRAIGTLSGKIPPAPSCAGYNPYFDLPPA